MRTLEVLILFMLLAVVMAGLSLPLWWTYAQPVIFALPNYIDGAIKMIKDYWENLNIILKQH